MMEMDELGTLEGRDLFQRAYSKALRQDLLARLTGRSNDLLPFEALAEFLQTYQKIPRPEPQSIPLDRIVGSVGRYRDFTRDFMPRSPELMDRWTRVDAAMNGMVGVPPIEVFKVGDVYFVADGNHRVSVARANGFTHIEAYVTEIPIDPGLTPGDTLDQAIIKAGRARFLAETKLDQHFEGPDIYFTNPGGYTRLLQHIQAHRDMLKQERSGSEVTLEEAAVDWYVRVYQPIVAAIREHQLLKRFPGRTAADLYVWIWNAIEEMRNLFGEEVTPDEGAALLELRAQQTPFRQALGHLMGRLAAVSQVFTGREAPVPDWAEPPFEWGDNT